MSLLSIAAGSHHEPQFTQPVVSCTQHEGFTLSAFLAGLCWGGPYPFCASVSPAVNRDEPCSCGLLSLQKLSLSSPLRLCFTLLSPQLKIEVILGWTQIVAPCVWTPPISCCSPVGTVWILIFISPSSVKESRKDINMLWKLTKKKKKELLPAKFLVEKPWLVQIQQNPKSP